MTEGLTGRLPELLPQINRVAHFFLGLDFDGTLAPIVSNPADARVPEETRRVLDELAGIEGMTVAVVSGRAVGDLCSCVGGSITLAGNHGLEIIDHGFHWQHPEALKCQPFLREICDELRFQTRSIPGALIEDKGLSASIHYRNVASEGVPELSEMVKNAVAPHRGRFLTRRGKKVMEILPRVPWHKGSAVQWMLDRLSHCVTGEIGVCYIGDDATDEYVFRDFPEALTIRVGTGSPTSARFHARDTREVYEFLRWLRVNWQAGDRREHRLQAPFPPQL